MPEGPELYKAAQLLNKIGEMYKFSCVVKADNAKSAEVEWQYGTFTLSGQSRGKEIRITMKEDIPNGKENVTNIVTNIVTNVTNMNSHEPNTLNILLTFGMTGRFAFTESNKLFKHSMLMFKTTDDFIFSFVDARHFGRWKVTDDWSSPNKRGPDIISEYLAFRKHVLSSVDKAVFNKPICEVMLDQKYFSGIGNYLRAEILHRMKIDPFTRVCDVVQGLPFEEDPNKEPDFLKMCHNICWEAINLAGSGAPYDPEGLFGDNKVFEEWLQCYMQDGMRNSVDSMKRTIWHSAEFGKGKASRSIKKRAEETSSPKKAKKRKSETKTESETLLKTKTESETLLKTKSETLLKTKTESETLLKAKTKSETLLKAKTESETLLKAKTKSETLLKTKTESETLLKTKTESETLLKTKTESETLLKTEVETEEKTTSKYFSGRVTRSKSKIKGS